jgi:hypothetical protein
MFIVGQIYAGFNFSTLAKQLQVDRRIIARIFERYKVNQSVDRCVGSGRQRITNESEDRMIVRQVQSNRRILTAGIISRRENALTSFKSYWSINKMLLIVSNALRSTSDDLSMIGDM